MELIGNIVINLYSIMILLILFMQARKKSGRNLQDRIFLWLLIVAALMLLFDTMGRFDGRPDTVYPWINRVGNFLIFLFNPVLPALWVIYAHLQVRGDEKKTLWLIVPCGVLFLVHTLLVVGTQFTGWFYTIDAANTYRRGPLYILSPAMMFAYLVFAMVIIVVNRRKIEKRHYKSLLFFAVPPLLASILHTLFYGISIVLCGVMLSILIVYLNIQNQSLITDYLTGVYNRQGFDHRLREMIRAGAGGRAFSAILLDYDHFKSINDTYGHDMGDQALRISSDLLKSCIRSTDFIARLGGDEFVILLHTASEKELEAVLHRINRSIAKFNESRKLPFAISLSTGHAVYDTSTRPGAEEFVRLLDQLMYQMKQPESCQAKEKIRLKEK